MVEKQGILGKVGLMTTHSSSLENPAVVNKQLALEAGLDDGTHGSEVDEEIFSLVDLPSGSE